MQSQYNVENKKEIVSLWNILIGEHKVGQNKNKSEQIHSPYGPQQSRVMHI